MTTQQNQHKRRQASRPNSSNKKSSTLKNWAIFSGIGLQMGLIIYLGNALGKWLDHKYALSFLENTITLLSVFAAMYTVIVKLKKINND